MATAHAAGCRGVHNRRPQKCSARRGGESRMALIGHAPLRLAAHMACAGANKRHSENEHNEAVKMVNFSRDGKHEEEIVASKRANRCYRARGSPGVGRRSVMATRFASS